MTIEPFNTKNVQLIWGCEPSRQLEQHWLQHLLMPIGLRLIDASARKLPPLDLRQPRVLVESGLLFLERSITVERVTSLRQRRSERIQGLAALGPFLLIHISDEEGIDGDQLYPTLPRGTRVWRNFPYSRFERDDLCLRSFPIGPRLEFLDPQPFVPASSRHFPWAFMGTIWRSGQRLLATSLFLSALPQGLFFGGRHFGQGVPLLQYKQGLLDSVFALCPEGDRHFDTFRLFESLQMGCLPMVVERHGQARQVLGPHFPLPIFPDWNAALKFVESTLISPRQLDQFQGQVQAWWQSRKATLAAQLHHDLMHPC